jgi:hypothetical protein
VRILNKQQQDTICYSKICRLDTSRLLDSSTDQENVEPCDDFKEYSLGKFIRRRREFNDDNESGFLWDIENTFRAKQKNILSVPVMSNEDTKAIKIAKNLFQKCIDRSEKILFFIKSFIYIFF